MNRMIMNFEAVVHTVTDEDSRDAHEVQLMVNGHVIYRWVLTDWEAHRALNRGELERVVSAHIYELLHPKR